MYIERSPGFDINIKDQTMLFDLCRSINTRFEQDNSDYKVKFIVELGELDGSILDNHVEFCRWIKIGELDSKRRHEFFKLEVEKLNLKNLELTDKIMDDQIFHPVFKKF